MEKNSCIIHQGYWSRRINDEHPLVYKVDTDAITIASCKYHYHK